MEEKLKSPIYINYLGEIPVNPDDLPERKLSVGNASDRPVGFTFERMHFLYWRVRYFRFVVAGFMPPRDAVTDFLMGGGAAGSAGGGLAGVAAGELSLSKPFQGNGITRIGFTSRIKNRIKDNNKAEGADLDNLNLAQAPNSPVAEKVLHTRSNKRKPSGSSLVTDDIPIGVTEGVLPAAGPIHIGNSDGVSVIIDFSSIITFRRLYWPRIMVMTPYGTSFIGYTSQVQNQYGFKTTYNYTGFNTGSTFMAYVTFDGAVIPIFFPLNIMAGQTGLAGILGPQVFGSINIPKQEQDRECCSRFYYDGSDEIRLSEAGNCQNCLRQGVGVKDEILNSY
jgi:hypothetical protein